MKLGHLRKLLEHYPDDCELLVEMVLPGEPSPSDMWHTHAREAGMSLVRGETVPNGYTHCGGGDEGTLRPTQAIIEVTFPHFDVTAVRSKPCTACGGRGERMLAVGIRKGEGDTHWARCDACGGTGRA